MNILILDDIQARHNVVESLLGEKHTILHAFDVFDAIEILEGNQNRIGLCLLGFRLNSFVENNNGIEVEQTACDLIEYIDAHIPKDKHPCLAIVHSHEANADQMIDGLRGLDIHTRHRPFSGKMIERLQNELVVQ